MSTNLEELHCKVNAIRISVRNLEVARPGRTSAEHDRIIDCLQVRDINVDTDVCVGNKCLLIILAYENVDLRRRTIPSSAIRSMRLCTISLSSFMLQER
jgi:hypothetical protein